MSNDHTYWAKITGDDVYETLFGYRADLPITCDCGLQNEWVKLGEFTSFWGCKKCYRKKMTSMIKLLKPDNNPLNSGPEGRRR